MPLWCSWQHAGFVNLCRGFEALQRLQFFERIKMICEKCWSDAYDGGYFGGCESQTERYLELLEERKDSPCRLFYTSYKTRQVSRKVNMLQ